jgi:hypothetical protein
VQKQHSHSVLVAPPRHRPRYGATCQCDPGLVRALHACDVSWNGRAGCYGLFGWTSPHSQRHVQLHCCLKQCDYRLPRPSLCQGLFSDVSSFNATGRLLRLRSVRSYALAHG